RRLGEIVESTNDAVVGADSDGNITFWNEAAARMYGYTRDEALGGHISMLYPNGHEDTAMEFWRQVITGRTVTRVALERQHKSGRVFMAELSAFPLRDVDGNIVGTASTSVDITDRVEAERALREKAADLDATFASVLEGIILIGTDLRIISFNEAAGRLMRSIHGRDISPGEYALDWVFEEDKEAYTRTARSTLEGNTYRFEQEIATPDGKVAWWELSFVPVRLEDGPVRGFAMSITDVTDRKQTEETLRQAQKLESLAVLAGGIAHD